MGALKNENNTQKILSLDHGRLKDKLQVNHVVMYSSTSSQDGNFIGYLQMHVLCFMYLI